ncbi:hypothetical protein L1987_48379 [Smallanthus sonchifolius]|uniref:Uncharacterized protein n=1 Tax=Smallanthus sonchifolius TaxID=185202 RepID=A0ACB9FR60_9ASTR|nr:hypothetical protein L1987_48379 [Smallanthus sonchifolius]
MPFAAIPREVEASVARQQVTEAVSTASTSTSTSTQLYQRTGRRPIVTSQVAAATISEKVPEIVPLPIETIHHLIVTTPIQTESVTITPTAIETTTISTTFPTSIPTTTLKPIGQPYNYGDFTQVFDFDAIFSSPPHTTEASTSRDPEPRDARINTLETQVAGLLETVRTSLELWFDMKRKEHEMMVKLVADLTKKLAAQGEREKPSKPSD